MILTMYAAGLRRSELCPLKVSNIDRQRMMLRVELTKAAWTAMLLGHADIMHTALYLKVSQKRLCVLFDSS